jgi:hypothetical protein
MTKAERKAIKELLADFVKPAAPLILMHVHVRVCLEELLRLDAAARAREKRKP